MNFWYFSRIHSGIFFTRSLYVIVHISCICLLFFSIQCYFLFRFGEGHGRELRLLLKSSAYVSALQEWLVISMKSSLDSESSTIQTSYQCWWRVLTLPALSFSVNLWTLAHYTMSYMELEQVSLWILYPIHIFSVHFVTWILRRIEHWYLWLWCQVSPFNSRWSLWFDNLVLMLPYWPTACY